jgi:hypothetical protein
VNGYSASEIEHSLNADEAVMNGAKQLVSELKQIEPKTLAATAVS